MREPEYRVTFIERCDAFTPNPGETYSSDEVDVDIRFNDGDLITGEYEYENDPCFGGSVQRDGYILFDTRTPLVAFTKQYDHPRERSLVRAFSKAFDVDLQAPSVPPASQHLLYREQGTSVYSVSFNSEQTNYERGTSIPKTIQPERRAKEDLRWEEDIKPYEEDPIPGVERIQEIAEECIETDMYVRRADIKLTDDQRVGFSDPLRFSRVDRDFAHDGGFDILFGYARALVER